MERKANRYERYAARFAAKEAGMKAIGTGWRRGVALAGFRSGQPALRQAHAALPRRGRPDSPKASGVRNVSLSLTHTAELGMAHVILED